MSSAEKIWDSLGTVHGRVCVMTQHAQGQTISVFDSKHSSLERSGYHYQTAAWNKAALGLQAFVDA